MMGMSMAGLLEVRELVKRFGGIRAVDGCSLTVPAGTIVGLCGPNGSGKSTVLNCVSGVYRPDGGRIVLGGQDITGADPYRVSWLGVGRTFQLVRIFPELSVLENVVVVGREPNGHRLLERSLEALEWVGLARMTDERAATLSFGQKKLLELARILVLDPKLLLLDEPAAGVNPALLEKILDILRGFNARGRTILVVEHNMKVITGLCKTVVVMDQGKKIAEGTPEEICRHPEVLRAYMGR